MIFFQGQFCTFKNLFLHLLSHYFSAAEDTAGRTVSLNHTTITNQTVLGSWSCSGTGLNHKSVSVAQAQCYPGTDWYGKGKEGWGESQLLQNAVSSE